MKRRHSEKGMALVITLMMLAIVTFMAVIFLSLSRRERNSVKVSEEQNNARLRADDALARAQADMIAMIQTEAEKYLGGATNLPSYGAATNQQHIAEANGILQRALFSYDLRSSKNFLIGSGYDATQPASVVNVNYLDTKGQPILPAWNWRAPTADYIKVVANLRHDPSPPVIVPTTVNGRSTNDFRHYLDLNRNGQYETNGVTTISDPQGRTFGLARFTGDPEWIGVLEKPDEVHSELNRFVGRYAYITLPMGKSLDINFIHNLSFYNSETDLKYDTTSTGQHFVRNQGVGSWELNMAAFLMDFHSTVWTNDTAGSFYTLTTNRASGFAFQDAVGLLQYRLNGSRANLSTARDVFGPPITNRWSVDVVDMIGDGPHIPYQDWYYRKPVSDLAAGSLLNLDNDGEARFWHGAELAEKTAEYPHAQRFFRLSSPAQATTEMASFKTRFDAAVSDPTKTNSYDRFAYYRLLAQMGTDSRPSLQSKVHLNFTNEPGYISSNLVSWVGSNGPVQMLRPPVIVPWNKQRNARALPGDPSHDVVLRQQTNGLTNFFLIAADAMLRASLVTNVYLDEFNRWRTNYTIGSTYFDNPALNAVPSDPTRPRFVINTPVRPDISVTNIQIYWAGMNANTNAWTVQERRNALTMTNAEYSAAVHRILQVAANIYDNMTNNAGRSSHGADDPFYPTVYRPLYDISLTNITIIGWEPQTNANFALFAAGDATRFRSPAQYFTNSAGVALENVSFYGQPWVIGVKKGWPTFNELSIETYAQVTRKLKIRKDAAGEKIDTNRVATALNDLARKTEQIYMIGFSNTFGLEAWNSYARTNQRSIRLISEIQATAGIDRVLSRDTNGNVITSRPAFATPHITNWVTAFVTTNWPGRQGQMLLSDAFPNPPTGGRVGGGSDFRVPIYQLFPVLPDSEYSDTPAPFGEFFIKPARFQPLTTTPDLRVNVTNRVRYLAIDESENRVIDYVTFDNLVTQIDLDEALKGNINAGNTAFGVGNSAGANPSMFWSTNTEPKSSATAGLTTGVMRQIEAGLGTFILPQQQWKDYSAFAMTDQEVKEFSDFVNGVNTNQAIATNIVRQVPFSPTRQFYLQTLYQANDPLVHYMITDLRDVMSSNRPSPGLPAVNAELGQRNTRRQAGHRAGAGSIAFQDPLVFESDDWQFPIAKLDDATTPNGYGIRNFHYRYPNIGSLGQIHRGTPWQTIYLKAAVAPNTLVDANNNRLRISQWAQWSGSYATHPTTDWKFVGLFTTAMTENAARGLLSVNQTNLAAWSAVLSGVPVIANTIPDNAYRANPAMQPQFGDLLIPPQSKQLSDIVTNINFYRSRLPMKAFGYLGEILGTPRLTVGNNLLTGAREGSPFLNLSNIQFGNLGDSKPATTPTFTDEVLEAIPQRILSLLKEDETRVVIYSFGQTLKPAPRSLATTADYYNLCVNYQVTGEYATKAVVRVEGELKNPTNPLRTVVESFEVLPPFE